MAINFDQYQTFGKDQFEAVQAAATEVSKQLQAIAAETTDYSKRSLESGSAFVEKLLGVTKFEQAIALQQEFAKTSYEGFVAEVSKLGELYANVAKEAFGFGDSDRDVIGGFGADGLDGVLDPDRLAGAQAELRRRLRGGVSRNLDLVVKAEAALFELFEQQVKRHHLGDGGRMARRVFVEAINHPAAGAIDDDRGGGAEGRDGAVAILARRDAGVNARMAMMARDMRVMRVAMVMPGFRRRRKPGSNQGDENAG